MKQTGLMLAGASLCAVATPAHAQQPETAGPPTAIAVPAPAAQEDGHDDGLGDIVVTAQRRAENLQNVPIAITAADAGALATARVENAANIQAISPSVTLRSSNIGTSSANLIIRGLGTTGSSRAFEGSVGVFIDGVYRSRAAAALQNFLDIDNLQILRGPQGTLFGKNTSAGALLLTSAAPDTSGVGGMIDVGVSNYDGVLTRAAVNLPLGDTLAVRVAAIASQLDGFITDVTTGRPINSDATQGVKAQALWKPGTGFSIRLIGDYSRGTGNCCYGTVGLVPGVTQPLIDQLTVAAGRRVPSPSPSRFETTLNTDGLQTTTDYGGTAIVEADIGAGTLNSITALRHFELVQNDMDADFSGADVLRLGENFRSRFFSQELTYTSRIEAIGANAVIGAFFSDERLRMGRDLSWGAQAQTYWNVLLGSAGLPPGAAFAAPGTFSVEAMRATARSYAGFVHLDAHVTERLSLIGGLRYSVEEKSGAFANPFYRAQRNDVLRILGTQPGPAYDRSTTDRALSGTAGVQYRPADRVMLYATYNRGFKAGGVNIDVNGAGARENNPAEVPGAVPLSPVYRPETVDAFEVGMKVDYLDRHARTNIALFHYNISDVQVAQFVGVQFLILNVAEARDTGVEIENLFQITPALTLGLDGIWIPRARFGEDPLLDPALSGQRFRFTPRVQGNATLNLDQPVADDLNLIARAQYQYSGAQYINTAQTFRRGAVGFLNVNLGVRLPGSGLSVEAWALNLTDEAQPAFSLNTPFQAGDQSAFMAPPRTYGLRLRATF